MRAGTTGLIVVGVGVGAYLIYRNHKAPQEEVQRQLEAEGVPMEVASRRAAAASRLEDKFRKASKKLLRLVPEPCKPAFREWALSRSARQKLRLMKAWSQDPAAAEQWARSLPCDELATEEVLEAVAPDGEAIVEGVLEEVAFSDIERAAAPPAAREMSEAEALVIGSSRWLPAPMRRVYRRFVRALSREQRHQWVRLLKSGVVNEGNLYRIIETYAALPPDGPIWARPLDQVVGRIIAD